ncbi:ImmA/IrrE family metallo-endopeptidase [Paractinoplanes maris]|uniref:ImmA/IrrE family metallo-endopeptidase n=1 Tax=Paractinoplanes maris TaxID=1734446 RepID=UPI002021C017|nr:ImmA/IrrE family metallo-endopeptidase [Actinoplanes maris]
MELQPLGDLVAVIEQSAGIDVAVLDASPDEHGLTMRDPQRDTVFIGVARTPHPMRQRSTLAHELGHVVLGDWTDNSACDWSARTPMEQRADAFARHLLVPVEGLRSFLADARDIGIAMLSAVVQRYLVSPQVAAIALEQARYISAETKSDWMSVSTLDLATRFGWIDQYRGLAAETDQRRAPQRLLARAIQGYVEGVVSVRTIATVRGATLESAQAELRDAGIYPLQPEADWMDPDELPEAHVDLRALDDALDAENEDFDTTTRP